MILEFPKRVTLKDIARHANLSVAAVSMALRNHASLPQSTIQRIKKIAAELGYRPDPALCALAAHRCRVRPSRSISVIALISNWSTREGWLDVPGMRELFDAAKAHADSLGFDLQHFWAREHGGFSRRLSDVLNARGIKSVVLAPAETMETTENMDWDQFSVVSLEPPPLDLAVPHVGINHYANVVRCWRELTQRGFSRVGFVTTPDRFDHGDGQSIAAHTFTQSRTAHPFNQIPVLTLETGDEEKQVAAWLKQYRPEAVIGCTPRFMRAARKLGVNLPSDVNYVSLNVDQEEPGTSGIVSNFSMVGEAAIDALNQLLQRGVTGRQQSAVGTHIEGIWREGNTLGSREPLAKIG